MGRKEIVMPNPWFRMYSEFEDDPKVRSLPDEMQIRLVWLMCEHCKGVTLSERHRTFQWRCSEQELAATKAEFMASGFIDEDWNLLNWTKRQYISDSSTERTRRHRERKRTSQERHKNVTVTPPDTDTDTESDIKTYPRSKSLVQSPEEFIYEAYPRRVAKGEALKAIAKAVKRIRMGETPLKEIDQRKAEEYLFRRVKRYAEAKNGSDKQFIPHPATWMNRSEYLTDEREWETNGKLSRSQSATNSTISATRQAISSVLGLDSPGVGSDSRSLWGGSVAGEAVIDGERPVIQEER